MVALSSRLGAGVMALACAACAPAMAPGSSTSGSTTTATRSGTWTTGSTSALATASASEDVGLGPPPCPPQPMTAFPWQYPPGGSQPYVFHRGQAVDVGVVLSPRPVAYIDDLRIDVVPATAGVLNGAGGQLTEGIESHVLRIHVADPAPGRYALTFRGLDDAGRPLPDGDYLVYLLTIETTRRTSDGCVLATPAATSAPPVSSLPPDAAYTSDGTLLLGTIRLIG